MAAIHPDQLTALADLTNQQVAAHATWRHVAESIAHELRRLAAAATPPIPTRWWPGRLDAGLRHADLPHGVPGITVDLHSQLVLDVTKALLPEHAAIRGWALVDAADLCRQAT